MKISVNTLLMPLALAAVLSSSSALIAQNKNADVANTAKPMKNVDVTLEVDAAKGSTFQVINSTHNLDIKTWSSNKVKIVTQVSVEEGTKQTDQTELLEQAGITLRSMNNRVELTSRYVNALSAYGSSNGSGRVWTTSDKELLYGDLLKDKLTGATTMGKPAPAAEVVVQGYRTTASTRAKRTITIFVPEGVKIDIDNRSSEVTLRSNFKQAKFDISNTTLDAQNIDELKMRSAYSVVNLGDIQEADVEFENGTFRAVNIKNLDIDSKSASIEYENGEYIYMRSQRDNYSVETVQKLEGRKLYGDLRIDKLTRSFNLEGTNADVKIRNITSEVELIKLDDKYADVRLPIKTLQNYSVNFDGDYSTVFAPFEKVEVKEDKKEEKKQEVKTDANTRTILDGRAMYAKGYGNDLFSAMKVGDPAPKKFTASVGDTKGRHTAFILSCSQCTLDFK